MKVQAFVPELAIKALHEGVRNGLPWLNKPQLDTGSLGPIEHGLAGAFGTVVEDDLFWQADVLRQVVDEPGDTCSGDRHIYDLPGQTRLWSSTMFSTRNLRQSAS